MSARLMSGSGPTSKWLLRKHKRTFLIQTRETKVHKGRKATVIKHAKAWTVCQKKECCAFVASHLSVLPLWTADTCSSRTSLVVLASGCRRLTLMVARSEPASEALSELQRVAASDTFSTRIPVVGHSTGWLPDCLSDCVWLFCRSSCSR